LFRKYRELFGHDDADDLCWFAPSVIMNPKLPQRVVEAALANDPQKARAEFQNVWREDSADFLPLDVIEASTDFGTRERSPQPGISYLAFVDAAGGTGQDSYALCVAHMEADGRIVVDATRERRPPFVPSQLIGEFAPLLRTYGIREVIGDGYAFGFHLDEWHKLNFSMPKPYKDKSDNYLTVLPALLAKRVRFNDDATLRGQLAALERKPGSTKETVGHPNHAGAHDDISDAVCGAIATLSSTLVRLAQRIGINRVPRVVEDKVAKRWRRRGRHPARQGPEASGNPAQILRRLAAGASAGALGQA
jgi:hypothetical protein